MTTTKKQAKSRSLRTLVQGAIVTGVVAVAGVVTNVVSGWSGDDVLSGASWVAVGTSAAVAVLTSVASYVAAHVAPPGD